MNSELSDMIHGARRAGETQISAEECVILTTATSSEDEVAVRFPNGEASNMPEPVAYWRVAVGVDGGGALVPRYPQRGETGLAIYMDTDEIWLIF